MTGHPRPRSGRNITRPSVWAHLQATHPAAAEGIVLLARYWHVGRAPLAAALLAALWDGHRAAIEATAARMAEAGLLHHRPRVYRRELAAAHGRIAHVIATCHAEGMRDPEAITARIRAELPAPGVYDWSTLAWRHAQATG